MRKFYIVLNFMVLICLSINEGRAQLIPESRLVDWQNVGLESEEISSSSTLNVLDFGIINDGVTVNDEAILELLNDASTPVSELFFPEGTYLFNKPIVLQNDAIIRGVSAGQTKFVFDNGGVDHLIKIQGSRTAIESTITQDAPIDQDTIWLNDPSLFSPGDYIVLLDDDELLVTSSWALNSTGQINKIVSINNEQVVLKSKLRRDFSVEKMAHIYKIEPIKNVKIENISIERLDQTSLQTSNIYMNYAANSQIKCVESYNCNFAHVDLGNSTNIEIEGSYFHEAFDYGGGGKAYGVMLHNSTGECLIQNSIFKKLRHSMILQSGANGNIFAYNYSTEPYWTGTSFPQDAAGDLVLHGNYPYGNLFEGNIGQQIVIDDSHGKNGPLNTFFRNRLENYGIFMNFNPPSDVQNFIGNEITNSSLGNYFLFGSDHFEWANNLKSTIVPSGSEGIEENSLYFDAPPAYFSSQDNWPSIGEAGFYNTGSIPAEMRFEVGVFTSCQEIPTNVKELKFGELKIWPNPTETSFNFSIPEQETLSNVQLFSIDGRLVKVFNNGTALNIDGFQNGLYFIKVTLDSGAYFTGSILKQ